MEKEKIEKALALATAFVTMLLWVLKACGILTVGLDTVGVQPHCSVYARFLWPFFHVSGLHVILNVWCLLALSFYYRVRPSSLIVAYVVCVTIPPFVLTGTAVGLSGVIFFLFGSLSFSVRRKLYWQGWMWAFLVVGFMFPNMAATVHLYCYIVGVAYAALTTPYRIKSK